MDKIIALINHKEDLRFLLSSTLDLSRKNDLFLEVLFVVETPLIYFPHYTLDEDEQIDKEALKNEIKEILSELSAGENVAIFVYIDDTLDRLKYLLKDDTDSLVFTAYTEETTPKLCMKIQNPILCVKEKKSITDIRIVCDLIHSPKIPFDLIKRLYPNSNISLLYNYSYIIDPSMEADIQNNPKLEQLNREKFEEYKKELGVDGEFFVNSGFGSKKLLEHLNDKDVELIAICNLNIFDEDFITYCEKNLLVLH